MVTTHRGCHLSFDKLSDQYYYYYELNHWDQSYCRKYSSGKKYFAGNGMFDPQNILKIVFWGE